MIPDVPIVKKYQAELEKVLSAANSNWKTNVVSVNDLFALAETAENNLSRLLADPLDRIGAIYQFCSGGAASGSKMKSATDVVLRREQNGWVLVEASRRKYFAQTGSLDELCLLTDQEDIVLRNEKMEKKGEIVSVVNRWIASRIQKAECSPSFDELKTVLNISYSSYGLLLLQEVMSRFPNSKGNMENILVELMPVPLFDLMPLRYLDTPIPVSRTVAIDLIQRNSYIAGFLDLTVLTVEDQVCLVQQDPHMVEYFSSESDEVQCAAILMKPSCFYDMQSPTPLAQAMMLHVRPESIQIQKELFSGDNPSQILNSAIPGWGDAYDLAVVLSASGKLLFDLLVAARDRLLAPDLAEVCG